MVGGCGKGGGGGGGGRIVDRVVGRGYEGGERGALAGGADSAEAVTEEDWGWGFDCAVLKFRIR